MINLNPISPDDSSIAQTPNETTLSYLKKKVDQLALDTVKESTPAVPAKKSIPERLEKNRNYALEQQANEKAQDFTIKYDDIPPQFEIKNFSGKQLTRSIASESRTIQDLSIGMANCQGRRYEMEDESLAGLYSFKIKDHEYVYTLLGLFDGSNGAHASQFVRTNMASYLTNALEKQNPNDLTDEGIFKALKTAFINLNSNFKDEQSGSTATVALILEDKIWIANTGDSRTILLKAGKATQATEDAKPTIPRYKKTVEKLGGSVYGNRVEGSIAYARAFGVTWITGIIPNPKITCYNLSEFKEGYLILACDGLYDKASTNEVGSAMAHMEKNNDSLKAMSQKLVYNAIMNGSFDNVSVIIAKL